MKDWEKKPVKLINKKLSNAIEITKRKIDDLLKKKYW